jgi:hypothetical protein
VAVHAARRIQHLAGFGEQCARPCRHIPDMVEALGRRQTRRLIRRLSAGNRGAGQ